MNLIVSEHWYRSGEDGRRIQTLCTKINSGVTIAFYTKPDGFMVSCHSDNILAKHGWINKQVIHPLDLPYLDKDHFLKTGDIIVNDGHVAYFFEDGRWTEV